MTENTATRADRETLGFQAEVKQLLQLMIHSLYSNREIFLRELISNASDACDKLRFEALHNEALFEDDFELGIRVDYDPAARTLTVTDNGIGMNRDEVIANLGTIAKSGTREFFSQLTGDQQKDAHLIGQFGVGFYSSFIVADKVTVRTRRAGEKPDQGVRWESDGGGEFTVEMAEKPDARHRDHAAPARGPGRPARRLQAALDHPQVLRPHRPADPDAEGGVEGRQAGEARRGGDRQPGLGAVGAPRRPRSPTSSTRSSTSTSATTSTIRWPGATRASRGARSTRTCSTSRRARRSTCGTATPATASSSTCAACSSWTTPSSCCRRTCASCAASSIPTTCRSTSRARSCRSRRTSRRSAAAARARCWHCSRSSPANDKEKYAKFWGEFGRVLKEGIGEDLANKDRIAGAAALRLDARRYRRRDRVAGRLHRPHEGRAGQDLLRDRRDVQRREEQPASRGVPQEGHRGAAAVRPRRRVGREPPDRVRRQAARRRSPRAGSISASSRTRPRRRRQEQEASELKGSDRADQGEPRRARQGSPRHAPPDRVARLPGRRRARHERQSRAPAQGRRPAGARPPSRSSRSIRSIRWCCG